MDDILNEIYALEREIDQLIPGYLTVKTINGKKYFYRRYIENGKRVEEFVSYKKEPEVRKEIEKRRFLESKLKKLKSKVPQINKDKNDDFQLDIKIGEELKRFCLYVKNFKKRKCFKKLNDYIYNDSFEKVMILYGLRRTGKTTLIRQIIFEMNQIDFKKTAFIQINKGNTLSMVKHDLKLLEKNGFKYIFIDEVTFLEDFIDGGAIFSDIFVSSGMKVVLSGTDSLGFILSKDESLYDRCELLHTTFISYKEFEEVLGIVGIDEYIRYGGTMSISGVNYNDSSTFATKEKTDEYIDSAIAKNIQHSLKYYQNGTHFRSLYQLYEKNELTNAINRVVEDINHRFTIEVINKVFKSNDLSISARNLRKDKNSNDILDKINICNVTNRLKKYLEIKDIPERVVEISDIHVGEIKEYLELLDLITKIEVVNKGEYWNSSYKIVFTQPGLRYAQANALVESIMPDKVFQNLSIEERKIVTERILNEIKGRMVEDIVLLETYFYKQNKHVFKCQFAIGEFDMVVSDPNNLTCEIYEIKHSEVKTKEQYKNLIDVKKCKDIEFRYGKITGKYVLYRGKECAENGIIYLNIEKYLKSLE